MKMYLLAGGLLITAASVYGVTDYMKTKNKKEFKELYKEVPVAEAKDVSPDSIHAEDFSRGKLATHSPKTESKPAVSKKAAALKKKRITAEKPKSKIEVIPWPQEVKSETPKPEASFATAPIEKKKLKKKINMKMFSRAPLELKEIPVSDSSTNKKQ